MSLVSEWNHRWFGLWKEMGPKYAQCPSIKDFITGFTLEPKELERVLNYLNTGVVVATTSRRAFPCVITGKCFSGSMSSRTDGQWLWYDHISYYVSECGVSLPQRLLDNIRINHYTIPEVTQAQIGTLERPLLQ